MFGWLASLAPATAVCVPGVLCPADPPGPGQPEPAPEPEPTPEPEPEPEPAPPSSPPPAPAEYRVLAPESRRLLELVNESRAAAHRPALTSRADLVDVATAHADRMARRGDIFHNDELFTASAKRRLGATRIGENVAVNTTVEDAHRRLMASEGHRANILDARFTIAGFGIVGHPDGRIFITEVFIQPAVAAAPAPPAAPQKPARAATPPPPAPSTTAAPVVVDGLKAATDEAVATTSPANSDGPSELALGTGGVDRSVLDLGPADAPTWPAPAAGLVLVLTTASWMIRMIQKNRRTAG